MPDTFANPYGAQSPLGAALKNLSTTLMKPSNEARDRVYLEKALAEKTVRENTAGVGDVLRRLATGKFTPDDQAEGIAMAVRAGINPDHYGGFQRVYNANQYGAADPRTSNAVVGAGGAYSSTAAGFREGEAGTDRRAAATLAENQRQFDSKPMTIGTDKGPLIVRQSEAYGQPAVEDLGKVKGNVARVAVNSPGGIAGLDQTSKQFIGAEGKGADTPRNYVAGGQNFITNDGLTDARTGQPLPQGGYLANAQGPAKDVGLNTAVTTDLQKADIEHQKLKGLIGYTRNLAKSDPNNFGVSGYIKGAVQDVNAIGGNIAQGLGYRGIQDAAEATRQKVIASGLDPGLFSGVFDPKLNALHTAGDLLVFQAASALAGQSGRSVTDRDIKMFKNIVGDPQEVMGNQQKYLAKLDTIEQILEMNSGIVKDNLSRSNPAARPAAPGVAAPPMSPAPGAPSIPTPAPSSPVVQWGRDANGMPVPMGQ